jgi:hypothetical protein
VLPARLLGVLRPDFHDLLQDLEDDPLSADELEGSEFDHETVDSDAPGSLADDDVAVEEAGTAQCAQHAYVLALPDQQLLHLDVELREFDALLAGQAGLEALECDVVAQLAGNYQRKRNLLDAHSHFLHG